MIGGQLISFAIGITIARWIQWPLLACGFAVLLAALVMMRLHCLHPPGGAAAVSYTHLDVYKRQIYNLV